MWNGSQRAMLLRNTANARFLPANSETEERLERL